MHGNSEGAEEAHPAGEAVPDVGRQARGCGAAEHGEDRAPLARAWQVDPFSSAWLFPGWRVRAQAQLLWRPPPTYDSLVVWRPKTWLLREGWMRAGTRIGLRDIPGPAT